MAIFARYAGPATLLVTGEGAWPADVDLVAERVPGKLGHWHGNIQASEEAHWAAINGTAQLELPDGSRGNIVLRAPGEVSGSGKPPFGDL
jgi:hypothetical protein